MILRTVAPASGAAQLAINWDNGSTILLAGAVVDVPPGGALESAIGLANLTGLVRQMPATDQQGSRRRATDHVARHD